MANDPEEPMKGVKPPYSEAYRFPGCCVRVDSVVSHALADLAQAYGHFVRGAVPVVQPTFSLVRHHDGLKLRSTGNGRNHPSEGVLIKEGQVMPLLERQINQHLVGALGDRLLLHAGAVVDAGRAVILPATSASGKTTMAAGLVQRGYGYLTDELVILHSRTNSIVPFPKAMSLKEGSFGLFESFGPRPTGPEYDRVWYLDPERLRPGSVVTSPTPIGWVIFPRFKDGSKTHVEPLTVGETVLGLFENTVNNARHEEKGLDRLIKIARKAPGYRLMFGDLEDACRAVLGIIESGDRPCT